MFVHGPATQDRDSNFAIKETPKGPEMKLNSREYISVDKKVSVS